MSKVGEFMVYRSTNILGIEAYISYLIFTRIFVTQDSLLYEKIIVYM